MPTRIYARDCLALVAATEVHAMSHITGGGLANNLARVIPDHLTVRVDRATWTPQPIFPLVQQVGGISRPDIEATLNMGVGMVAVVPAAAVDATLATLGARGIDSWACGEVRTAGSDDGGRVILEGRHAA